MHCARALGKREKCIARAGRRRLRTRAAYVHATHALTRHAQLGALAAFIFGFGTGALRCVCTEAAARAP
jgi:hypothetical protein